MKVYRVTITDGTVEAGVVFELDGDPAAENKRSGRAIVTLPPELGAQVIAAGQAALEAAAAQAVDLSHGITTELHRLRVAQQDKERQAAETKALAEQEARQAVELKAAVDAAIAQKATELAEVENKLQAAKDQAKAGEAPAES